MGARIAGGAALSIAAVLILTYGPGADRWRSAARAQNPSSAATPAARQPLPRMFSPGYAEALRDILDLEEADVERLERRLAADPEDFSTRLRLMACHRRADRSDRPEDRAKRARHALWLIEHHPDSELLHSPFSLFSRDELTPEQYQRAVEMWNAAAQASPNDAGVLWNAASFFQSFNVGLHLYYLEATAAADPDHPFALRPLAHLYARLLLDSGPLAERARAGLEASKNVWVLGNAAYMLQGLYNRSVQMGRPDRRAAESAERWFLRAKALDPSLDREKILPSLDLPAVAESWEAAHEAWRERRARLEARVGEIRRLPVEAFPELPPVVAGALRARGCAIPQPSPDGARRNVIRGEFFEKGEAGWAALCSVNHSTDLLVFRNDSDAGPETLSTSEDVNYLEGVGDGPVVYSHEIRSVGRDVIMGNYRAYGGPEPPPIEHHGVEDALLGKVSIIWYFHNGEWLRLTGAD